MELPRIRQSLAAHAVTRADANGRRRAAVAMILAGQPGEPRVLFIERAVHEADPWSGHMAFPGGRVDPEDSDAVGAAERETLEEVGVDLARAERLGQLDDMEGHNAASRQLVISGFVYYLPELPPVTINHEVQEAIWFPLRELHARERQVHYPLNAAGIRNLPGILVGQPGRHIVWGLTHRFLEVFFRVVGAPLPDRYDPAMLAQIPDVEDPG